MEKAIINFSKLNREDQKAVVEALIFSSEDTLPMKTLVNYLSGLDGADNSDGGEDGQGSIRDEMALPGKVAPELVAGLIDEINDDLAGTGRPFRIANIGGGYQYATRSEYGELVAGLVRSRSKRRLSQKTIETLAIIAYKQPISKPEIEQIRGVHSGELVNSLIDKGLVKIVGRKDVLGKPLLYGTTDEFLKVFGINALEDLPRLRDLDEFADGVSRSDEELEIVVEKMEEGPLNKFEILQKKIEDGIEINEYSFGEIAGGKEN